MNLKRFKEKPDQRIIDLLHGPKPPDDFEGNGCTLSPDFWFREACRIHDWEYDLLYKIDISNYNGKLEAIRKRKEADENLKKNIEILSTYYIDENNQVVKGICKWYHRFGFFLGRVYFGGVRSFGWIFVLKGKN
ncbi:MAG TPA: hypothetical protein P5513_06730 [Candidatus Diapherotrites archaeon]|nr:hypothetical protein [Candidatus Diapherotrites archaeon]